MQTSKVRPDPHSCFRSDQPRLTHVKWTGAVDMDEKTLICTARLRFSRSGAVDLDTRGLKIKKVMTLQGRHLRFRLERPRKVLGSRLSMVLPAGIREIDIVYTTSPDASGLQWLTPAQTVGKVHPYVYTQGEAIHARSIFPCQDSPGVRFTFEATLNVPKELRGIVAADTFIVREEKDDRAIERWAMTKPVPAYLFAFAVGDLVYENLSERSRVWTERPLLAKAKYEFAQIGKIMAAAERLFGKYPWGRFDILVLPASFPYGGMENPTLTFVTPSLLAGDRSMVDVIAHELAHAWTGNLITNATWGDFWLNEGWTTWAQYRIVEAVWGRKAAMLQAGLLVHELRRDLESFEKRPHLAALFTQLSAAEDPDETFSRVPYCKGYLFLKLLEETVGRSKFDRFVRDYIKQFGFQSITTAQFLKFLERRLPGIYSQVNGSAWVYGPGLPGNVTLPVSGLLTEIEKAAAQARIPTFQDIERWGSVGIALYLQNFPRAQASAAILRVLNARFGLARHHNHEVRWGFLLLVAEAGCMKPFSEPFADFLGVVGRVKYLKPLYKALAENAKVHAWARAIFERNRSFYHLTAQMVITGLFKKAKHTLRRRK